MLKLIVVDDEPLYRQYLVESVEWENYGFEICCEAKNGLDALEKIGTFKPDIALVDINMPFMNGLELIERLRDQYSNIAVILVTGHNEFDYARKAIKLGALDYILKPFNNDELMVPLLKIKESIEKDRLEITAHKAETEMIKGRLLNLLISNEFILKEDEMIARLSRLGINIHSLLFRVAIVEIDNMYQRWSEASEIVLWQFALANILNEITNIKGKNIIFNGPEGRIISLIQFEDDEDLIKFSTDGYQRLCEVVRKYFDFTVTVGIGRPARGFEAVRGSYKDALAALQNKLILSNSKVIDYSSVESNGMNIGFYPSEINENLLLGLKMGDIEVIKEELANIFSFIKEQKLSVDYTMTIFAGLVSLCLSYIVELGKSIEDVFGKNFSPYSEINNIGSLETSLLWFTQLFEKVIYYLDKHKLTKSKLLVKKVKDYIDSNLQDNELDIGKISKNVFINSSYLRKTFKKEIGITVSDYITSARMQKAKELLTSDKDIAISRISEVIGYSDAGYFSKCFKKYTGLSPSEYGNSKK
ncbi:response regulator [Kineothrix sp. MB12-C1]|uniref:response regulator n=1 Tax=Kineothrix sp. MB12-C1 TaxID=3070215 RepID=UPI0027D25C59|nr:response regulator [Kineothrix sp. MB12-C1]WMC94194.1 response regulator [Kineothrix sp. MB12-C1]